MMRSAVAFLTPFGRASTPTARTTVWFPWVGMAIGLAVGGLWWASSLAFPALVAAAIAVGADLVVTGCLHFDGLADAADGLLPPLPRQRRLEVMRDPAVGAFGAVAVALALVLRTVSLAAMHPKPWAMAGLWGLSRTAMALTVWTMPYARDQGGLASAFVGDGRGRLPTATKALSAGAGLALCVVLVLVGRGLPGLVALGAAACGFSAVVLLARARVGGFTGDVLGAAGVVGETLGLIVLAAKWS